MYYTLTLNPSLDYVMHVETLRIGETNRSAAEEITYGGKGINVALMLRTLGKDATALGFVGGFTGEKLLHMLENTGLRTDFVQITEATRINVKLSYDGAITEVNAKGPAVSDAEREALLRKFDVIGNGDTLVLSGSIPSSLPKDIYARIMRYLSERGVRFAVDTTGDALLDTLPYAPFVIKPNQAELEELTGETLADENALISAARNLQKQGARNVLVSLGGDGAILVAENGEVLRQKAPQGKVLNTVGAGDSMLAAFLVGAEAGMAQALSLAVAAGSATAFSQGLAERAAIEKISLPPQG